MFLFSNLIHYNLKEPLIYSFPKTDPPHILIDFHCAPRNYIIAAREHFDKNEIREALAKTRQALESLAKDKILGYVRKHGDSNLRNH